MKPVLRWAARAWLSPSSLLLCSLSLIAWKLYPVARTAVYNASLAAYDGDHGVLDMTAESRDITIAVLRPCKPDKPETCGLIPAVRQTVQGVGDVTQMAGEQVKQSSALVTAAATGITGVADQAKITLAAAGGAAQEATTALGTMNQTIAQAQPLLGASTALLTRTDLSLNDPTTGTLPRLNALFPKFSLLADNLVSTTGNVSGITDSLDKMGKHIEKKIDAPQTKVQKVLQWVPPGVKVGATVACLYAGVCP